MPTRQTVPRLEAPRLCGEISMGFPRDLRWGWSWGWTSHMTHKEIRFGALYTNRDRENGKVMRQITFKFLLY